MISAFSRFSCLYIVFLKFLINILENNLFILLWNSEYTKRPNIDSYNINREKHVTIKIILLAYIKMF